MSLEIEGYTYFLSSQPYIVGPDGKELCLGKQTLLVSSRDGKAAQLAYNNLLAGECSYAWEKAVPMVLDKLRKEEQAREAEQEVRAASLLNMVDVKKEGE